MECGIEGGWVCFNEKLIIFVSWWEGSSEKKGWIGKASKTYTKFSEKVEADRIHIKIEELAYIKENNYVFIIKIMF